MAVAGSNEFGIYLRGRCPVEVTGGGYRLPHAPAALAEPNWNRCWLLVRSESKKFRRMRDEFLRRCRVLRTWKTPTTELYLLARLPQTARREQDRPRAAASRPR